MLTRCPHCDTTFRVGPEQLKARQGKVRCGQCRGVFNALEGLVEETLVTVVPGMASPAGNEPIPEDLPDQADALADAIVPENLPAELPDVEQALRQAETEDAIPTEIHPPPVSPWPMEAPLQEAGAGSLVGTETGTDAAIVHLSDNPPLGTEATGDVAITPEPTVTPTPAATVSGEADDALPAQWTRPDYEPLPEPQPEARRWPWAVGAALLLATGIAQLAFIYRVELAVRMPAWRPALQAACDALGCDVPYPRKPELVAIESSDLAPEGEGRLLLTASLKNRATFAQAYPHLELTLTDTRDEPLLRKVLAPADYLPKAHAGTASFAARGEAALRLLLEAKDVPAAGYRLYLFYP